MKEQFKYTIKNRIWICTEEGTFLGEGRVSLLKKIDQYGSISKAAKAMNMSYKKAWGLVNSMNSQSKQPLVTRTIGGKGGGGTFLTTTGKRAIELFNQINSKSKIGLDTELDLINNL